MILKKFIAIFTVLVLIFMTSCTAKNTDEETSGETTLTENESTTVQEEITTLTSLKDEEFEPARVFTAYFSHHDPIEAAAEFINEKTQGTLFRIETVGTYPENEEEYLKQAAEEHNKNIRPALKNAPSDMKDYDIIFLLFPAWSNTIPMAVWTFIEDYDMRNKIVVPVCYGKETELNNAIADIHSIMPPMQIVTGYNFSTDFLTASEDFTQWLNTILYG